jgi:DNA-3-methyladenine glycosylase
MFGPPGRLYTYFVYGMHWCANVVCGPGERPHAVLLRAATPEAGLATMRARRTTARRDRDLLRGPANLARAFNLGAAADGASLLRGALRIVDDDHRVAAIAVSTRVGLAPGKGDDLELRFAIAGDPHVSAPRPRRP